MQEDLIRSLVAMGGRLERYPAGQFHFKTTTNGVLLDEESLKFFVKNDVLIAMSIDVDAAATIDTAGFRMSRRQCSPKYPSPARSGRYSRYIKNGTGILCRNA